MVLGLDTRLLGIGLLLGIGSIYLDKLPLLGSKSARLSWASTFLDAVHSSPFFPGVQPDKPQEQPPVHVLSPRHQQEAKREAMRAMQTEEARIHAPVYFLANHEFGANEPLKRISHELAEHVSPKALFIVSTASDADHVQLSISASLPPSMDDVLVVLREAGIDVKWTEEERRTTFEELKTARPSISLTLPSALSHGQALAAGMALHRFREQKIAFLIDSPAIEATHKIIDAMTHYTSTDRHRTASAYAQPLLSLAAGAADEAEGEVLMQTTPLLLRFGHVEDHGEDII